jgi:hypothetical protein
VEHHQPSTIAILGSDTVVGRTLCVLLEGHGYQSTLLDSYPIGVVDELLDGAHLLILTPKVDQGVREAFLGAMGKNAPQKADMPVIALHTAQEEDLPEKEGVISVPWPYETKVLVERIEAAFLCRRHLAHLQSKPEEAERLGSRHASFRSAGNPMRLIDGAEASRELRLPYGYSLDRSDPDVLVLLCSHGTVAARFSARGATAEAIEREARTHYGVRNLSA